MPTYEKEIGDLGEDLACQYLQRKGYQIIKTNYHSKFGEIDIIARITQEVSWLIFVEVKTRTREDLPFFGYAEQLVDWSKEQKLIATANRYLDQQNINPDNWRLDIIVVNLDYETRKAQIRHFENI